MPKIVSRLLFILLIFAAPYSFAQVTYEIMGVVVDEKQQPISGATVFISGSKKMTATDNEGRFLFDRMATGNYTISASMLGLNTPPQPITVQDKSISVRIVMEVKPIVLNEVKIGKNDDWKKHYALFKDQFLGTSGNAKHCVILNPEVISFTSEKISDYQFALSADADDLLIIENKKLGYRILYLLRTFSYNPKSSVTFYDGDSHFEELEGSGKEKKNWAANRLKAYQGSLMQYLRAVFAGNVLKEGFISNQMVRSSNVFDPKIYMKPEPVNFDTLVRTIDSSFVSFKFTALHVEYNPKKAARMTIVEPPKQKKSKDAKSAQEGLEPVDRTGKSSQLLLHLDEAVIDERGSILTGYKTFLIRGYWANKRIGDQLPMEYLP